MVTFHNPDEFPYEAFVQRIVEQHFQNQGFKISKEISHLDIHAKSIGGTEEWRIECKGKTSAVGLDFNTGLGQILKKMDDENANYALALPDIPSFRNQTDQISRRVRDLLSLSWIWVKENGELEIQKPK